ncbi:lipopolysaccharide biosynthesis protein [Bacteroidales bacterium]|nr:lipopolysaccharide biosynthesis protein [Bacteroidales bacterium]
MNENNKKKIIVVSAVNIYEGGTLKVMQDCLKSLSAFLLSNYKNTFRILALVHDEALYDKYDGVEYVCFPKARKTWFHRMYYEFWEFRKFSLRKSIYLWLSMHDISPNVVAERRVVYCHNPSPFYKPQIKDLFYDYRFFLFTLFYSYLYALNIKKNTYVVVQQNWLRNCFEKKYKINNVIVSFPNKQEQNLPAPILPPSVFYENKKKRFFYPSLPRTFKNFELIGEAVKILNSEGVSNFEVLLTIDGSENKYAKYIYNKYKHLESVCFVGLQSRSQMNQQYMDTDCVIFPSKLETWGLPISETKSYNKPILLVNLPYAKESIGEYDYVKFFDSDNSNYLAYIMFEFIKGNIQYDQTTIMGYKYPFSNNWEDMFSILLSSKI